MFQANERPPESAPEPPCAACGQPGGNCAGWVPQLCSDCYLACGDSAELAAVRRELEPYTLAQLARANGRSPWPIAPELAAAARAWVPRTRAQSDAAYRRAAEAWLRKRKRGAA